MTYVYNKLEAAAATRWTCGNNSQFQIIDLIHFFMLGNVKQVGMNKPIKIN